MLRHRPPARALRAALAASRCSASPVSLASPVVALADARDDLAERLQRDHCVRVSRARLRHRARASVALPARRGAAATSASLALRAALADLPHLASTVSPVAMLADARGDLARLRRRADARPPLATPGMTVRDATIHLELSNRQRLRIRKGIADNRDDANATVTIASLRLNAAHCRHRDPRVALARVRFPHGGRGAAPPPAIARASRCACGLAIFDLRYRRSSRSLTLATTLPNAFNEIIACGRLALASGIALARPWPFRSNAVPRQRPHRWRCAPRSRTCRARPLRSHRSPCSLTLAATVLALGVALTRIRLWRRLRQRPTSPNAIPHPGSNRRIRNGSEAATGSQTPVTMQTRRSMSTVCG